MIMIMTTTLVLIKSRRCSFNSCLSNFYVYHIELQERLQFIRTPILFHFIVLGVALSQFVYYICLKVPKRKKGEKRPMGIWSYFHGTHTLSRLLSSCSQQKQSSFNTNHAEGPPSWVRSAYRRLGIIQEPGETCC